MPGFTGTSSTKSSILQHSFKLEIYVEYIKKRILIPKNVIFWSLSAWAIIDDTVLEISTCTLIPLMVSFVVV